MNKIPMTIFFSNFGIIDENSQKWANCQTLADFESEGNKSGCSVTKMSVSTDNNFQVSKRLKMELDAAKGPIKILAEVGIGSSQGKTSVQLKDFEISK